VQQATYLLLITASCDKIAVEHGDDRWEPEVDLKLAVTQQCRKHTLSCPPSCWVPGRTLLSVFDGKLAHACTFSEPDAAVAYGEVERLQLESRAAAYKVMGLDAPTQFRMWQFLIYDGTNAPPSDVWARPVG